MIILYGLPLLGVFLYAYGTMLELADDFGRVAFDIAVYVHEAAIRSCQVNGGCRG